MNDDQVVQKILKLLENNTAFIGYALNGGVGTKINVRNTETGKTIQALSINVDSTGEVLVVKDSEDNQYKAVTFKTAEKVSTRNIQIRKTRPIEEIPVKTIPQVENIKILFYVDIVPSIPENLNYATNFLVPDILRKEVWIGGTWTAKKIYTTPEGYRLADVFIVNTGEKEEDYTVMGRLFPVSRIHSSNFSYGASNSQSGTTAAILFTIEKGVLLQQEFNQDYCPPYFWKYCGGGFFYSGGGGKGVNTIVDEQYELQSWPPAYNWYSDFRTSQVPGVYLNYPYANYSFLSIAVVATGMYNNRIANSISFPIKPGSYYRPLILTNKENMSLIGYVLNDAGNHTGYAAPKTLFGLDTSSSWYFKTKTIKTGNINTYYSYYEAPAYEGPYTAGRIGFSGDLCVTPNKNFNCDFQSSSDASLHRGYLYEPLIVNTKGDKTLTLKQLPDVLYTNSSSYANTVLGYNNSLWCLSDSGVDVNYTKISGIPLVNNPTSLGRAFINNNTVTNRVNPTQILGLSRDTYFGIYSPIWQDTSGYTLELYWYSGSRTGHLSSGFSFSANQSERNKEVVYLKDFLLEFARFTGLTVTPSDDIRKTLPSIGYLFRGDFASTNMTYFKPLSSYIDDSIYIPYGFLGTGGKFYGVQALRFSEPEKTRALPQSNKATIRIVELKLDKTAGEIKVTPNIKNLAIYMVTPEKTGNSTIALASASYWCKEKTKGKPMPVFTYTSEEVSPTP